MKYSHNKSIQDFNHIQSQIYLERQQNTEDRRFCWIAGAQWDSWGTQQFENKPRLEINKAQLAVTRINNEYRENRISVTFIPGDGVEDETTTKSLNSLYRAGAQHCGTEYIDNAFVEGITGGIGAWRLRAEYVDEYDPDNEHQMIMFEPIFDADSSVYFDLNSKRMDKSDATQCWVIYGMDREAYEEKYNDDVSSWPKDTSLNYFDWATSDTVYIAEHYIVDIVSETVHWYGDQSGEEIKVTKEDLADQEYMDELSATGYRELRNKKIKTRKVHKYLESGSKVIEDCGVIAGKYIPIIPFYGKRNIINNIERASGHIRTCKDSLRLLNMQTSKLAEISALSSVEKPIFFPQQISGHEMRWASDNIENFPYLLINPLVDQNGQMQPVGAVGSTKAPEIPPAMAALLQITNTDLADLLGNQQNGEMLKSNQGDIATELIQSQIAMQTSGYISNLALSVEWCGKVWLSMAKEIFVEPGRKIKGLQENGKANQIELMRPVIDKKTGEKIYENDFSSLGEFDVVVEVGPSSASKRAATEKGLIGLIPLVPDPETQAILSSMVLINSEGEGMSELRPYFRKKLIGMGAIDPTEEEAKDMQAQAAQQQAPQPTPADQANVEFLNASAQAEQAKAENLKAQTLKTLHEAEQVKSNTALILANAEKSRSETMKNMANIDMDKRSHFIDVVERLHPDIENQNEDNTEPGEE